MTRTVCSALTLLSLLVMARLTLLADGSSKPLPSAAVATLTRGELNVVSEERKYLEC